MIDNHDITYKNFMKRFVSILVFCFVGLAALGQKINVDGKLLRWETEVTGGLNVDGIEVEANVGFFPIDYLGMKLGLGVASEIEEIDDWGKEEWEKKNRYAMRCKLRPALALRSPRLINWRSRDAQLYLFCEPGMVISPGAQGSRGARIVCWDLRSGFNMQVDNVVLTLGYGVSNFALYSGDPISNNPSYFDTNDYITHMVFVGIGFKF